MKKCLRNLFSLRCLTITLVMSFSISTFQTPTVHAAPVAGSLEFVPSDVGFYSSFLRNREQVEILLKSNWWAKLKKMPAVQIGWNSLMQEWDDEGGPGEKIQAFLNNPKNKELYELGLEMVSDEVFFYGDEKFADLFKVYTHASNANSFGLLYSLAEGDFPQGESALTKYMLDSLNKDIDLINVPTFVMGFKIKSKKAALNQLKRLEILKQLLEEEAEEVADKFKKTKIAGYDFWVLNLSGEMLPWDELGLSEEQQEKYKKLLKKLRGMKIALCVGIYKDYVILSVGPSTKHIATFGKGNLLVNRKEFAPLKKFSGKKVTGIGYVSKKFVSQLNGFDSVVQLADWGKKFLALAELDKKVEKKITDDIDELLADIKELIPDPGAALSVTSISSRGYDFLTYNWSKLKGAKTPKKLTILDHVGGSPMLMIAGRTHGAAKSYATTTKWLKKGFNYFQEYAAPNIPAQEREMYDAVLLKFLPLIKRTDKITRELMLPATAEGQSALIVDSTIKNRQWHPMLPKFKNELGLPQIAYVCGLSDAVKFTKAMEQYRELINDTLAAIRSFAPNNIPPLKIPEPKKTKTAEGTIYSFALPPQFGLDKRIAINYGVSKSFAAGSFVPSQTAGLLKSQPLKVSGPLSNYDRPMSSAYYIEFAAMVDLVMPWVEGVLENNGPNNGGNFNPARAMIGATISESAKLLKSIHSISGYTYQDGDATVSRSELHLKDIPK